MRKALFAAVFAAFAVAIVSAATATASKTVSETVSLRATLKAVRYGTPTTLSGAVSSGQSGQIVTLQSRTCVRSFFKTITTGTTGAGGAFSIPRSPTMNTVYQVQWGNVTSPEVAVQARPGIRLAKLRAPHKYRVRVRAAQSLVGRKVLFQRHGSTGWRTVQVVRLHDLGGGGKSDVSGRIFKARLHHGHRVRIIMRSNAAKPCYVGTQSNVIFS